MSDITRLKRQLKKSWPYFDRLGNLLSIGDVVYCLKPLHGRYLGECLVSGLFDGVCIIEPLSTHAVCNCSPSNLVKVDDD